MRNQQASISNIETQVGQLSKLVQEHILHSNSELILKPHVMAISNEKKTIFEPLVILEAATKLPNQQPKEVKEEMKNTSA